MLFKILGEFSLENYTFLFSIWKLSCLDKIRTRNLQRKRYKDKQTVVERERQREKRRIERERNKKRQLKIYQEDKRVGERENGKTM